MISIKNIVVVGAGNIGSRHLQALAKINFPLSIYVIDPLESSLKTAQERYNQVPNTKTEHNITFQRNINSLPKKIDVAIIASNSNVRKMLIEKLLSMSTVDYLILEKILFQKVSDYYSIQKLLTKKKCTAYVNCCMRIMPFYQKIKNYFGENLIIYSVTGSQYGLITNSIHYIDHLAYLSDCYNFKVNANNLIPKLFKSKRQGFYELNGTIQITFDNGNIANLTCFEKGNSPVIIEINSPNYRLISIENERKALMSEARQNFKWKKLKIDIPFQSEMTNIVINELLKKGTCRLTPYNQSMKLHLSLIKGLMPFVKKISKKNDNSFLFT